MPIIPFLLLSHIAMFVAGIICYQAVNEHEVPKAFAGSGFLALSIVLAVLSFVLGK